MDIKILGAGTAGLVAALLIREKYPFHDITIIKSGEIGIVGVGEGSTEHWNNFMEFVGIDVLELIHETSATIKIGILFKDWNYNSEYVHSISEYSLSSLDRPDIFHSMYLNDTGLKFPLSPGFEEIYYKNKVQLNGNFKCSNQYHFDTFKLNDYLVKKCIQRNVRFIDTKVNDITLDHNGNIFQLITEQGNFTGDLFIDCSGFKRVLSTKLGNRWISKSKYLPLNRAIAFPTEHDISGEIEPYTTSTALSAGWSWKIPTRERYGNGYVFSSDYITADQAQGEIGKTLGKNIEKVARDIKFDAGRVEDFWLKNVVSIGLSGSFAEPLEAQSIGFTIIQSMTLINYMDTWSYNKKISDMYNKEMNEVFDNVVDYLQLHYLGNRNDTKFWQDRPFELTDFNKNTLEQFKEGIIDPIYFKNSKKMFRVPNWYQVLAGLQLIDKNHLQVFLQGNRDEYNSNIFNSVQRIRSQINKNIISHKDYINLISENYHFRKNLNEN